MNKWKNSKSYTTPAFSRVSRDLMTSENNTESYQALPLSVEKTSSTLQDNVEFYYR